MDENRTASDETIEHLKRDGFYGKDLNDNPQGWIVRGPNWVIYRQGLGDKAYAYGFSEAEAWAAFLGLTWIKSRY